MKLNLHLTKLTHIAAISRTGVESVNMRIIKNILMKTLTFGIKLMQTKENITKLLSSKKSRGGDVTNSDMELLLKCIMKCLKPKMASVQYVDATTTIKGTNISTLTITTRRARLGGCCVLGAIPLWGIPERVWKF